MWKECYLLAAICFASQLLKTDSLELCQTFLGYEYFIQDVMENTEPNTEIGHVVVEGNNSEIEIVQAEHTYFSFNNITRNVTLKSELDTDQGAEEIPPLILNCRRLDTEGDLDWLQIIVNVLVTDWNDNSPVFNSPEHSVNISEDSLVGTAVYSDLIATDKDKNFDGNSRIAYRIVPDQEYSSYFLMEVPTIPVITLRRPLDYEQLTNLTIFIEARDSPNPNRGPQRTSTATLTVNVLDADDQNPEFSAKTYRGVIREDALPGSVVSVIPGIFARDPDSMNVPVIYTLLDPYEFFMINATTAEVRNTAVLNDVDVPTLTVVVLASQVDNPNREWFAMLTITISEANVNAPSFSKDVYRVTRLELEPVGSVLVTTTARDPDFKTIMGTVLEYAIVDPVDFFSIDESGSIILEKSLDYEQKDMHTLSVTASDGIHTAQTTVEITVLDVNDNNPRLNVIGSEFQAERIKGLVITTVTADDNDLNDVLSFELRSNKNLFKINYLGEISIIAEPEQLTLDRYSLLVSVLDDGKPQREASKQIDVIFPTLIQPPTASTLSPPVTESTSPRETTKVADAPDTADDNMMTIVLGAVAGVLLVVILILIVYIVWRNKRTKEELDRARAPRGHAAKGLTYRQAEVPDDLPKMDLNFSDDYDGISDVGATTVQENPLRKQGVNQGYLQSSGSEMDRDVSEIEVETAVVPYDDDFGYPSGHGQFRTFHGDDTTSNESNHSDSTGNSQRILVNGSKNDEHKMTSWDSDDKIHPQGAEKLLDAKSNTASRTKKDRPEITVYF